MKVLVTGGSGYIGSVASHRLLDEGHEVRIVDSLKFDGRSILGLRARDGVEFVHGDITASEIVESALDGMDAVVHLAAIVGDPACAREPELATEVNREASLRLFEAARENDVERFIFSSTCSNYGKMDSQSAYLNEESNLRPVSHYAETKVAVEEVLLKSPKGQSPATTVLRFATVFGLSPRMRFDLTVNEFTRDLLMDRHLIVFGEQFWRPYIHVEDVARAICLVLASPKEQVDGEVFNVGDKSQNYRKADLIELILKQVDDGAVVERVHKEEDPRDYRVSFEKIANRLDFAITRTVEDGVEEIIDAIKNGYFSDPSDEIYRN